MPSKYSRYRPPTRRSPVRPIEITDAEGDVVLAGQMREDFGGYVGAIYVATYFEDAGIKLVGVELRDGGEVREPPPDETLHHLRIWLRYRPPLAWKWEASSNEEPPKTPGPDATPTAMVAQAAAGVEGRAR